MSGSGKEKQDPECEKEERKRKQENSSVDTQLTEEAVEQEVLKEAIAQGREAKD